MWLAIVMHTYCQKRIAMEIEASNNYIHSSLEDVTLLFGNVLLGWTTSLIQHKCVCVCAYAYTSQMCLLLRTCVNLYTYLTLFCHNLCLSSPPSHSYASLMDWSDWHMVVWFWRCPVKWNHFLHWCEKRILHKTLLLSFCLMHSVCVCSVNSISFVFHHARHEAISLICLSGLEFHTSSSIIKLSHCVCLGSNIFSLHRVSSQRSWLQRLLDDSLISAPFLAGISNRISSNGELR